MKSIIKYVAVTAGFVGLTALAILGLGGNAEASQVKLCILDPLPMNKYAKSFDADGKNVTATFTLRGDNDCKFDMTLATFETPSANGHPIKEQKLYSHKTGTFGPGTHKLTTTMPNCYYQLDLVVGAPIEAEKGTRLNDFINRHNFVNQGHLAGSASHIHDAIIGGDKPCEVPEPTPEPTPQPTPEPKPEVKPAAAPEALPKTGAAAAGMFVGISSLAGAAHAVVSRKKLQ